MYLRSTPGRIETTARLLVCMAATELVPNLAKCTGGTTLFFLHKTDVYREAIEYWRVKKKKKNKEKENGGTDRVGRE